MSEHRAKIAWQRGGVDFTYETYSRDHEWEFEGEVRVAASAAPAFRGSAERVDPEEAFVAAVSSCHMLTFLAIAARSKIAVESYTDEAVGFLEKNADGRLAMTRVELKPRVVFAEGHEPTPEQLARMHESSHKHCFIANSVNTEITVEK
jgi:organic hydroperoxide reductase OsmC/OhrA